MRITDNGVTLAGSSVVVPVDIQGADFINSGEMLPVKQAGGTTGTGTNTETDPIEIITLLTSEQVRDGNAKTVALPSLLKYKRYVIQVFNGLDQDLRVVPWNTAPAVFEDDTIGIFSTTVATDDAYSWVVPKKAAANSGVFFLNEMAPKSNAAGTKKVKSPDHLFETRFNIDGAFSLAYKASAAPTTGSITIRFIGVKR
jgi:hypothetical protein